MKKICSYVFDRHIEMQVSREYEDSTLRLYLPYANTLWDYYQNCCYRTGLRPCWQDNKMVFQVVKEGDQDIFPEKMSLQSPSFLLESAPRMLSARLGCAQSYQNLQMCPSLITHYQALGGVLLHSSSKSDKVCSLQKEPPVFYDDRVLLGMGRVQGGLSLRYEPSQLLHYDRDFPYCRVQEGLCAYAINAYEILCQSIRFNALKQMIVETKDQALDCDSKHEKAQTLKEKGRLWQGRLGSWIENYLTCYREGYQWDLFLEKDFSLRAGYLRMNTTYLYWQGKLIFYAGKELILKVGSQRIVIKPEKIYIITHKMRVSSANICF